MDYPVWPLPETVRQYVGGRTIAGELEHPAELREDLDCVMVGGAGAVRLAADGLAWELAPTLTCGPQESVGLSVARAAALSGGELSGWVARRTVEQARLVLARSRAMRLAGEELHAQALAIVAAHLAGDATALAA